MSWINAFVLCLYLGDIETKVTQNFKRCEGDFFYKGQSPIIKNPHTNIVHICQRYNNTEFYATLYDTNNRIPVYSALKMALNINQGNRKDDRWFVEPMITTNTGPNMAEYVTLNANIRAAIPKKQAIDSDYLHSNYDKGHLNPQMFNTLNDDNRYATNTFTNIAPQFGAFNKNTWASMEDSLLKVVKTDCNMIGAKPYLLVGVQPSTNKYIHKVINNINQTRVNVPKFYWTAVCCDTSNTDLPANRNQGWSFAYKADNLNRTSVSVTFDPVDKILPKLYSNIFADYRDMNGITITGCQFNKTNAIKVITKLVGIAVKRSALFERNPTARF